MRSKKVQMDLEDRRMDATDLMSRCRAAARMALRGQNWSSEDRADCAAELVTRVWADAVAANAVSSRRGYVSSSVRSGAAVNYSQRSPRKSKDTVGTGAMVSTVPESMATFTRLFGLASNWRRGVERERARDMQDALLNAERAADFSPFVEAPASETGGTPWGARRTALDMLRATGLLGESESPQWGPVWSLAYSAARAIEAADVDGYGIARAEVAEELELTEETLRQHLSRAVGRIPAAKTHTRPQWAEALHVPVGGIALKPSRSRAKASDMGTRQNGPREHLPRKEHAAVTVKRNGPKRQPQAWTRGSHLRPDWTRGLDKRTAQRLQTAAQIRMDRDRAKTDTERETLRLAALAQ